MSQPTLSNVNVQVSHNIHIELPELIERIEINQNGWVAIPKMPIMANYQAKNNSLDSV